MNLSILLSVLISIASSANIFATEETANWKNERNSFYIQNTKVTPSGNECLAGIIPYTKQANLIALSDGTLVTFGTMNSVFGAYLTKGNERKFLSFGKVLGDKEKERFTNFNINLADGTKLNLKLHASADGDYEISTEKAFLNQYPNFKGSFQNGEVKPAPLIDNYFYNSSINTAILERLGTMDYSGGSPVDNIKTMASLSRCKIYFEKNNYPELANKIDVEMKKFSIVKTAPSNKNNKTPKSSSSDDGIIQN